MTYPGVTHAGIMLALSRPLRGRAPSLGDVSAFARRVAALARDVSEYLAAIDLPEMSAPAELRIAYHAACSLQHGQRVREAPKDLLRQAGFTLAEIPESHLCCGSAGTYNLLQPELATRLRERKLANIARVRPDVVATGNIGCMVQLADGPAPVVHTVELLDWATGGPVPRALAGAARPAPAVVAATL